MRHKAIIEAINEKGVKATDEEYARREVAILVPDFPEIETLDIRGSTYALASALEGTQRACGDLHAEIKRLRDVLMAVMDNCGCCESDGLCGNCMRIDEALSAQPASA